VTTFYAKMCNNWRNYPKLRDVTIERIIMRKKKVHYLQQIRIMKTYKLIVSSCYAMSFLTHSTPILSNIDMACFHLLFMNVFFTEQ